MNCDHSVCPCCDTPDLCRHWEEKNIKAWGRQRLIELVAEVSADLEGGGCIRVTQLKDLIGEVCSCLYVVESNVAGFLETVNRSKKAERECKHSNETI